PSKIASNSAVLSADAPRSNSRSRGRSDLGSSRIVNDGGSAAPDIGDTPWIGKSPKCRDVRLSSHRFIACRISGRLRIHIVGRRLSHPSSVPTMTFRRYTLLASVIFAMPPISPTSPARRGTPSIDAVSDSLRIFYIGRPAGWERYELKPSDAG